MSSELWIELQRRDRQTGKITGNEHGQDGDREQLE